MNYLLIHRFSGQNGIIRGNGRWRWAVYCQATRVTYFADRYGKRAAQALCNRLNAEVKP